MMFVNRVTRIAASNALHVRISPLTVGNSLLNRTRPSGLVARGRLLREVNSQSGKSTSTTGSDKGGGRERLLPKSGPLSLPGIMLFLATCVGMVVYYQSEKKRIQDERTQRLMEAKEVGKPKLGGPFELIDHDGKPVTNRDYLGRFSLIYFGFCHCPDICPDELDKIGEAVELLDQDPESRDMVTPLFITCDPQRDDPATIKQYLKEFHPKIIGLTGTIDQVRKACKTFRVYFSKPPKVEEGQDYLVDHSIFSYLMDSNGNFVDIYGKERTSAEMADSIKKYIKAFKSSSGGQ